MDSTKAQAFAREWVEAWNAHDLPRVLSHYAEEFEMTSPYIPLVADEPSGTLKGKARVAEYWRKAMERMPELHFELKGVALGMNSLALHYHSAVGNREVIEVLGFDAGGKVVRGHAHYSMPPEWAASS